MDIVWEDPPEEVLFKHANRGGKYVDFALALKAIPGKWAVAPAEMGTTVGAAQGAAQNIRAGKIKGFTKGYYEAVAKDTKLWVRCKPEAEWPGETPAAPAAPQGNGRGRGNGSDDDPPEDPPELDNGDLTDRKEIRAWARKNGWPELSDRGRIAQDILAAYVAAKESADS